MKANRILPFRPIRRPGGSRKRITEQKKPGKKYAVSQTAETVGSIHASVRSRAGRTRSRRERRIVLWTMGRRKGGNSSTKEGGIPRSRVWERSHDINREAVMLRRIRSVNVNAGTRETNTGTVLAVCRLVMDGSDQNSSEIMNSRIGSCLLHGTKELVKMAIRRSRGESMDAD